MLQNYIKMAWRNLVYNKGFSLLNISGLALGLACSLLIMLWVQDERSMDAFHANTGELYHVYERVNTNGQVEGTYLTQGLLAEELKRTVPEVRYASSMEAVYPFIFQANDKIAKRTGSYAGSDFFSMFSFPLLRGTKESALNEVESIAISRSMAEFFFGRAEDALGKGIRYENREDLVVTAVFEDLPASSTLQFDFLRSWKAYVQQNDWLKSWENASPLTFVQLKAGADPKEVNSKIKGLVQQYTGKTRESYTELALQPFAEKYLHSNFKNGQLDGGRIEYVYLFSLIAVFILLIACINFMNLATARSFKRSKEVGVRKVMGARPGTLRAQFLSEAVLVTIIAMIISLLIVAAILPVFNQLTGKSLALPYARPFFWLSVAGLIVVTGFIAGSYPALFLAALNPVRVMKSSLKFTPGALFLRKGLVVFQFALSILLIVGMIVISKQMDYVQAKNLSYNRENLIYLPIEGELIKKYEVFKQQAAQLPTVSSVSKMRGFPTLIDHSTGDIRWVGKTPGSDLPFADANVGHDFVKTMKLKIKEGRDFSDKFADAENYLVNETAVKKMGYQSPVGKPVWWGDRQGTIIGVVKDFHFSTLYEPIKPLIIRLDENPNWGTVIIRTEAGKTRETLSQLEQICKRLNPGIPFTYQFSDQEYQKLYKSEQIVSQLSYSFSFLAIFISCLGLFGLAMFTAGQRTKELGVRKVLGASTSSIISLLSASFLKPVAVAMFVAFPVAWYAMNNWLQNFAYRIDLDAGIFVVAGVVTLLIALATISFQSVKSAMANPVKSLRAE